MREQLKLAAGRPGNPAPRRRLRPRLLPAGEPGPLPRGAGAARLRPPLPRRDAGRPRVGQRRRGQRRRAEGAALPRGCSPATRSAKAVSSTPTIASCAASPALPASRSTRLGSRPRVGSWSPSRRSPATTSSSRSTPRCRQRAKQALAARGLPGAFVTMNVHNGQILGLGSFPTFDPSVFTKPKTQAQVNALYRDPVAAPLTDRATQGLYPTGSTFKLITAMAALNTGVITPQTTIVRRRLDHRRGRAVPELWRRLLRPRQPRLGAAGLLRRLLLHAGSEDVGHGRAAALGAHARDRAPDRDRPARADGRAAAQQAVA